jgi:hypothetical protein
MFCCRTMEVRLWITEEGDVRITQQHIEAELEHTIDETRLPACE